MGRSMVGVEHTLCHVADDLIGSGLTPKSVLSAKMRSLWRKMRLWYELCNQGKIRGSLCELWKCRIVVEEGRRKKKKVEERGRIKR